MNINLYQILGVNQEASIEQINSVVTTRSPKDNPEVGKALLVLSEPVKLKEYDEKGWQSKWDSEFEEWIVACNATFKTIHSHIGYGVEPIYHLDEKKFT